MIEDKNSESYIFKCRKCEEPKTNLEFPKKDTAKRIRKYSAVCKVCTKKRTSSYYKLNPEKAMESHRKYKNKYPVRSIVKFARGNAKRRNIEYNITEQDALIQLQKQGNLCYYTKDPLRMELGFDDSISLDRIDNTIGYLPNNIALCKYRINVVKNNVSLEYLLDFCKKVNDNKENILNNYNNEA